MNNTSKQKSKSKIVMIIAAVAVLIAIVLLWRNHVFESEEHRLMRLGSAACQEYRENKLPALTEEARTASGLSDLTLDVTYPDYPSSYYGSYDKSKQTYKFLLQLEDLHSDEIDNYYTTSEDATGRELRTIMSNIERTLKKSDAYSYKMEDGSTVTVEIDDGISTDIDVISGAEHTYNYYHSSDGFETVEVDSDFAYFDLGSSSKPTKSSSGSYGSSGKSYSNNSSYSGSYSSGNRYSSGSKGYYESDDYNVQDYDDPDDFAYDNEYDFSDYEDAYDYWEDNHED